MANFLTLSIVLCILCNKVTAQLLNFSNPVLDIATRDVSILKIEKLYYLVFADDKEIKILKSEFLADFRNAEKGRVYKVPPGYTYFYPSFFFAYENDIYLYFHMLDPTELYHMFAVKAQDSSNPLGPWTAPVRLTDNIWHGDSVHGAVLQTNSELYFLFSSSASSRTNLYIAKMKSPTEVLEPVVLLKEPTEDWECFGQCTIEAPSFLYHRDNVYMVFSESASQTTGTSISYMSIEVGQDPMNRSNWVSASGPVFQGNDEEAVYSTRFPEFTTSLDGTETWMLYTASNDSANIVASSRVRIEKIEWDLINGTPKFPVAQANGHQQELPSGEPQKFVNPIFDGNPGDVHIYNNGDTYYMVTTKSSQIVMLQSDKLYDFRNAESAVVYTAPEGQAPSSPRIFELDGDVYLYFHLRQTGQNRSVMYVLKAANKSDLMQNWGNLTRLLEGVFEENVYHGTVMQHNDQLYFVWVHTSPEKNVIYIAFMVSPTQVVGPAILLKEPVEPWELQGGQITDYPFFLYNNNTSYLIYSASSTTHPDCSLSYMSIETGKDALDVTSWYSAPIPVFTRNDEESVYATCHACFSTSPDSSETWMLYIASHSSTDVSANRNVRLDKINWNKNTGAPIFPKAHGYYHPQAIPSYFEYFTNPVTDEAAPSPGIVRIGDFYYMLVSSESELEIWQSGQLTDFRNAEKNTIYSTPDDFSNTGGFKMHNVNGHLYIYFSMEQHNSVSQMFVLRAYDASNPMGKWDSVPMPLATSWNVQAFHSTLLEHDENFYLVWVTPNPATGFNSIYIAKMTNATHLLEPFNIIRHPTDLWECEGGCSNEAPYFIYNKETAYMVLSVGAACKGGNALTYMSIGEDMDPLNAVNWQKAPGKVFNESLEENVFCTAHAAFTVSPDQQETWMVYHATDSPHPDAIKYAYIERINWDQETGEPIFPKPHGSHHQQLIPGRK